MESPDPIDTTASEAATSEGSVTNVAHADHVDTSITTEVAAVVRHAETIGRVEVNGEPLRSKRERLLREVRDIARSFTALFALVVMVIVIIDKNRSEDSLRAQLTEFQDERAASDLKDTKTRDCLRRFQDKVDEQTEGQLIIIGEFLVVITQIPPGAEREAAVREKIKLLDQTNILAAAAVAAKIDYNNQGNPLPCPLGPSEPPGPPIVTPLPSTTTPATTGPPTTG